MLIYVKKDIEGDAVPFIACHEGSFLIPRWRTKHVEMAEREKKEKFNIPDDYQLTYITWDDYCELCDNAKTLLLTVTDDGAIPQYCLYDDEEDEYCDCCDNCCCEEEDETDEEETSEEKEDEEDSAPHGNVFLYVHGSFDNDN